MSEGQVLPDFQRRVLHAYAATVDGGQATIARDLDVSRCTVNRWLNGWSCGKYEECLNYCRSIVGKNPEIAETAMHMEIKQKRKDSVARAKYIQEKLGISYRKARLVEPILSDVL